MVAWGGVGSYLHGDEMALMLSYVVDIIQTTCAKAMKRDKFYVDGLPGRLGSTWPMSPETPEEGREHERSGCVTFLFPIPIV